ncbi:MAG TPA: RluA family pseudouridine synthase [Verrucomicrobiae bacterium]|jgi:23S rRNA pseudouridine1911/1915/1917 synthase|nr:RluA family pseudouridine synthase [Verrucomicrobiae bacterium]
MMEKLFEVIFEDGELLVINKPAGLVCHPTKGDVYSSLISRVRLHLGAEARAHLVNRLDRETSGVVLVAKSDVAARELRKLWEERVVRKEYWAIVHGRVASSGGSVEAALGRDTESIVAVKDRVREDGALSRTDFEVVQRFGRAEGEFTWLRVWPHTGRKHQIRIHLAHIGHAIVGDKLYGGDEDIYMALVEDRMTAEQRARMILPWQGLHAREVRFVWRGVERVFAAEAEGWFMDFLREGGVVEKMMGRGVGGV